MTSRKTETRHSPTGKTCHHFLFHRLACDEFDALSARANGHCEICGAAEEDTKRGSLVVDHFYAPGAYVIRGMLCDWCNTTVMACIDGKKVWGTETRKWEAKGHEYEANSWDALTPEVLVLMAARKEKRPKNAPRRAQSRETMTAISIPARRGVPAMAASLREWLTPVELAELAALLSGDPTDAM
ncbi:MAG TPA: endonuclease domain-containing protein [Streptosporangiaceae bacterium]|nr:endonuclease domain-containing protein [Streptosporangiaceae bacterium]